MFSKVAAVFGRFRRSPVLVWAPIRFLPLVGSAGYIGILHATAPGRWDWVVGMTSAVLALAGGRWPLPVSLAQSVLLVITLRVLGPAVVQPGLPVVFALAVISVGELVMRRHGWPCWLGLAAFVAAQVVAYWPHFDPLLSTASIVATTAAPALLGLYIRSVLQVAVRERQEREIAVREARAAERVAIARELHDLVAHHIASIALRVGAAGHALGTTHPEVAAALAEVHDTARTALADLRRLLATLRDPARMTDEPGGALVDPASLSTALAAVVDTARGAGLLVDAEIDPAVENLDSVRRLAVLRVLQEGLTNVIKHGGAHARTTARVVVGDEDVRVHIADNGGGRPAREQTGGGFGLIGMRERVELLGGTVQAGPRSSGWTLTAVIPHSGVKDEP